MNQTNPQGSLQGGLQGSAGTRGMGPGMGTGPTGMMGMNGAMGGGDMGIDGGPPNSMGGMINGNQAGAGTSGNGGGSVVVIRQHTSNTYNPRLPNSRQRKKSSRHICGFRKECRDSRARVLIEMIGFQRNMSQQDFVMQGLIEWVLRGGPNGGGGGPTLPLTGSSGSGNAGNGGSDGE
ncbi:hypothetical protein K435DRAFT_876176 [Dendrothele bispora CBS 962.96]|uniref:Uncharacterized protein n=1 Tax=Dendrothele bispora (strain CBS 962.96) TaxID=1314807 RepID=A0A4S8KT07_DENBC|nr:hypothetical protein K435DRAFT_876176 [Dendrothele bispora CBS 962.96]